MSRIYEIMERMIDALEPFVLLGAMLFILILLPVIVFVILYELLQLIK